MSVAGMGLSGYEPERSTLKPVDGVALILHTTPFSPRNTQVLASSWTRPSRPIFRPGFDVVCADLHCEVL
jgi:hypothetical protein